MTSRRALVSLPDGIWNIIDNELKGKIGDGDSEVIRNIVIAYLIEKGYFFSNKKESNQNVSINQIAGELDIHDSMITSLAELLEERGVIKLHEWDKKTQLKLQTNKTNS
jgi:hypothetical protein